ncbi:MAG: hypothetical protein WCG80_09860 [Spirochaetales bacterium]
MIVDNRDAVDLRELLEEYGDPHDLEILLKNAGVQLPFGVGTSKLGLANYFLERLNRGTVDVFLLEFLYLCEQRAGARIARTDWDVRDHHRQLLDLCIALSTRLTDGMAPRELHSAERKPFTARSTLRELISTAETEVFLVDNYVDLATLDIFRECHHPIKLLTGPTPRNIPESLRGSMKSFRDEGFRIEVRTCSDLHDRILFFNEKAWLLGSSIKHAGVKQLNMIQFEAPEIVESVMKEATEKWNLAQVWE